MASRLTGKTVAQLYRGRCDRLAFYRARAG